MKKTSQLLNTAWHLFYPFRFAILFVSLLNLLVAGTNIGIVIVSKNLIDTAIDGNHNSAVMFALALSALFIGDNLIGGFTTIFTTRTEVRMVNHFQQKYTSDILQAKWLSVNSFRTGDLLTLLANDINYVVEGFLYTIPLMIALSFQLLAAFFIFLSFDSGLAIFIVIVAPISILFSWLFSRRIKKAQHKVQRALSNYKSYLNEIIYNMLIVKTFSYEKRGLKRMKALQETRLNWIMKRTQTSVIAKIILNLGYHIAFFVTFAWGVYRLSTGSISFGTFTAFLQLVDQIQDPFEDISRSLLQLISTITSLERLGEIEALEPEEGQGALIIEDTSKGVGLSVKDLTFRYNHRLTIFDRTSLTVEPNEIVALMGPSGIGKTTFFMVLMSLLTPESGSVEFYSGPTKASASLHTRRLFSYVPQDNSLFSGTIAENLRIANQEATDQALMAACSNACIDDLIHSLDDGLQTEIGEHGFGLSEGQIQRLALARSFLSSAPILLLDEATSALDVPTEQRIIDNIKQMNASKTCLIITHRPSILAICDRVYRLDNGSLSPVMTPGSN